MHNLPQTAFSRVVDPQLVRLGQIVSWIWLVLLIIIVANVLLRYAFSQGRIEFEEIQWHLYSIGFLFGMGYTYQADAHIRVDVLHERLSPRMQVWIELYGILLFLLPFIAVILIYSIPFVLVSFQLSEISQSPGGLPYRWAIKAALPIGFTLLLVATVSRLTRVWAYLFFSRESTDAG